MNIHMINEQIGIDLEAPGDSECPGEPHVTPPSLHSLIRGEGILLPVNDTKFPLLRKVRVI
jgi:hypothetical protein